MIKKTFSQAPTSSAGALYYKRSQETMKTVSWAMESLGALDGDSVDLNKSSDLVVVGQPVSSLEVVHHREGMKPKSYARIEGVVKRGTESSLDASLVNVDKWGTEDRCSVSYSETAEQKTYSVGGQTVTVEKTATGELLTYEQWQSSDAVLDSVPVGEPMEASFSADGPERVQDAALWESSSQLISQVESEMEKLKTLDNSPQDLAPAPGVVVLPNIKTVPSDNIKMDGGWDIGSYKRRWRDATYHDVPVEASLEFNPETGEALSYNSGFGDYSLSSFENKGDGQSFQGVRTPDKGSYLKVHRKSTGETHVQGFKTERQATLDLEAKGQQERQRAADLANRSIFEMIRDSIFS